MKSKKDNSNNLSVVILKKKNYLSKNSTIESTTDRNKMNNNKNNSFENEPNKQYRLDAFGNIISKKCKSHHVSFIDQISSQKLVEFCQMENNEPIVIEKKIFSTCRSCILF